MESVALVGPLFARTFLIGIAVAAPVGAMGVLCIERTLAHGWRAGATTGLAIATADGAYAAVAAFGLTAVSATLLAWQTPLQIAGGLVLCWLGLAAMRAVPPDVACRAEPPGSPVATYATTVALTLTNPTTIMAFAAVFAGSGLVGQPGASSAAAATLGVAAGSLAWWLVLTTAVTVARGALRGRVLLWVTRASGALLLALGATALGLGGLAALT